MFGFLKPSKRPPRYSAPSASVLPPDFDLEDYLATPWVQSARVLFNHPFFVFTPWEKSFLHVTSALKRDSPVDVFTAWRLLGLSALAERARRGFPVRSATNDLIWCELIPEGFVIERQSDGQNEITIYAADARAAPTSEHYRSALHYLDYGPDDIPPEMPLPLARADMIAAQDKHRIPTVSNLWAGRYLGVELLLEGSGGRRHPEWCPFDRQDERLWLPLVEVELKTLSRPIARAADASVGVDRPHG